MTDSTELPFARSLFDAADSLRGSVEASEYKHLVLGLLFLRFISRVSESADRIGQPFVVPPEASWDSIVAGSADPDLPGLIDRALGDLEAANPERLTGVLPTVFATTAIPSRRLAGLVQKINEVDLGSNEAQARDLLGRAYEYFLKMFAKAEGHRGGEFYTPSSVARLLVEMLEPFEGAVFDPACGTCGLFIQSADFIAAHGKRGDHISLFGQENVRSTWRLGRMNLAIHKLDGEIRLGNSLTDDQFPDLAADYVIANPPFNLKSWGADEVLDDSRWDFGHPSDKNANYAWIQHFVSHLSEKGRAGFVMGNGSLTSVSNGDESIRAKLIEAGLVDCIVALPQQLFFTTSIPVCLWFLDRGKSNSSRSREILFIDGRSLGHKISRTQAELREAETAMISSTYHAWREGGSSAAYQDLRGFCRSVPVEEVSSESYSLSPGLYVGVGDYGGDGVDFDAEMTRLVATLEDELEDNAKAAKELKSTLARLGYE